MLEPVGAGLRPLTTTAIVDAAIEHVREDPVLWYGIVAPVSLPFAALGLYFFDLVRDYRGEPAGYGWRVGVSALLLTLLFHLRFVAEGALAWALDRRLRGLDATAGGAWWAALRRSPGLVFAGSLLWALALAMGVFAFVPAIVPFGLLCLAPSIVMIEQTAPFRTLRRSVELGWVEIGRSVAIAVILGLGALVLALGAALALRAGLELARTVFYADLTYWEALLGPSNPTYVLGALLLGFALLEPVKALAFALLYVDRRVRTEGFDLKQKVQKILLAGTVLVALALGLAPRSARAEDLAPADLAERLAHARRSAHEALSDLDAETDEDGLAALRKDAGSLAGAHVRSGAEVLDVDPGLAKDLERLDAETTTSARRDRLARIERRLESLEKEARRAGEKVAPPTAPRPAEGPDQVLPAEKRPPREALSRVLDQPRYRKRTENLDGLGLAEKLESVEQRLLNLWARIVQPTPTLPRPAWLTALLAFIAAIMPRTFLGWFLLIVGAILLVALLLWMKRRRDGEGTRADASLLSGGLDGHSVRPVAPPEESFSEEHWRREARLLAGQGDHRGAIRALYTGALIFLQRAGRLKFDKGKTNWEHVRELRRNDRALAERLEPLTRTFDAAWYGQKEVEPAAFDAFLADTDSFTAAAGGTP